jgi:hypothetical protein
MSSVALSTRALDASVKECDQFGNTIMPLNDIGLDGYIRYKRYEDGPKFSEIDVVKIATGKSTDYAGYIIRRLSDEVRSEVRDGSRVHKFKGPGQKDTTLITLEQAYKLIMIIPCSRSKAMRLNLVEGLTRKLQELQQEPFLAQHLCDTLSTKFNENNTTHTPRTEWIYATVSDALPGLVKIGRTQDISKRLSSGNTFIAPMPHSLVAMVPTLDSKRDERRVHNHFADKRDAGEFFQVNVDEVQAYFSREMMLSYQQEMMSYDEEETENSMT